MQGREATLPGPRQCTISWQAGGLTQVAIICASRETISMFILDLSLKMIAHLDCKFIFFQFELAYYLQ